MIEFALSALAALLIAVILVLVRTKRSHFIFGAAISSLGLLFYLYANLAPQPVESNYSARSIQYDGCYFNKEENGVVLTAGSEYFLILRQTIETTMTLDDALSLLCNDSEATIWHGENPGLRVPVKAIETENLQISLASTMHLDSPNQYASLAWLFMLLGVTILVLTFIFGSLVIAYAS